MKHLAYAPAARSALALAAAFAFWSCPVAMNAQSSSDAAAPAPAASASANPDATHLSPEDEAKLREALVKASQNPVGNITILPFQNNWNNGVGPQGRPQYNLNFQPVVPIMLAPNLNLIARAIVPVINNPSSVPPAVCAATLGGCPSTFGLGDLTTQFFFAPKTKADALIWGVGPQFLFPSGNPASLSAGQYGAGPAAVALIMPGDWVIGDLTTQMWSYAGDATKPAVNSLLTQPFINYNFGQAWALTTAPIITAAWNAAPNNRWTVPVGGGISKTFKLGDQPMQLGLFYYVNVVRPANAPVNQFRLNWSLLFPVKRGAALPQ
jgi:hypothetical protein